MIFPHGGILHYIPCKFLETLACECNFQEVHLEYYGKIMICHFDPGASNVNLQINGNISSQIL